MKKMSESARVRSRPDNHPPRGVDFTYPYHSPTTDRARFGAPLQAPGASGRPIPQRPPAPLRSDHRVIPKMRLLVVEDERKVASFLKRGLEEAGHVVDVVHTGSDGEYLAMLNAYDALLLDCLLPDKDGRLVCRDLRAAGYTTPVLILTARDTMADKILSFDSGANQFLARPFDFGELLARVRALGRSTQPPPLQPLALADLEIDPASRPRRLTRPGGEAHDQGGPLARPARALRRARGHAHRDYQAPLGHAPRPGFQHGRCARQAPA